jgi:hypothetical protein
LRLGHLEARERLGDGGGVVDDGLVGTGHSADDYRGRTLGTLPSLKLMAFTAGTRRCRPSALTGSRPRLRRQRRFPVLSFDHYGTPLYKAIVPPGYRRAITHPLEGLAPVLRGLGITFRINQHRPVGPLVNAT